MNDRHATIAVCCLIGFACLTAGVLVAMGVPQDSLLVAAFLLALFIIGAVLVFLWRGRR